MKTSRRPKYAVRLKGKERRLWVQPAAEIYDDGKTFGLRVFVGERKILELDKVDFRITVVEALEDMLPRETWGEDSLVLLDYLKGTFFVGDRLGAIPMPKPVSNKQLLFDYSVAGSNVGGGVNGTFYGWLNELLAWRKEASQKLRSQMLISLNEDPEFEHMIKNLVYHASGGMFWELSHRDASEIMGYAKLIRELDVFGLHRKPVSQKARKEIAVVLEELGAKIAWAGGVHGAEHRVREERLRKLVEKRA